MNIRSIWVDKDTPDWDTINSMLLSTETREERDSFNAMSQGRGPANHKANIRLFDSPDGFVPDVTLYRDTAGWCPYCFKIWLQLEEKRIPYIVEKVPMRCYGDKPQSFYQLSPSGGIPVAIIKGRVISESDDIMTALEENYPTFKPLMPPANSPEYARARGLFQLERKVFNSWFTWLTSRAGKEAANEMDSLLKKVDSELALSKGPYFLGDDISLVDIKFAPFLERMAASLPYYKGFVVRDKKYPNLLKWYEAMDTRDSYQGIKSDYYTHIQDLPPQIGGCQSLPESQPYATEIGGGAWHISKKPSECFEPMLPLNEDVARRDAARRALANKDNLTTFALRGIANRGRRYGAPLANPDADTNSVSAYRSAVDVALRQVLSSMLAANSNTDSIATSSNKLAEGYPSKEVKECMLYIRDRVGVPRDMTVHGARQFRAYINNFVESI